MTNNANVRGYYKQHEPKPFGEKLRELRKAKKLTQYAFAEKVGIDQKTLRAYEYGKHLPNIYTAIDLADALNVSLDELTGRRGRW